MTGRRLLIATAVTFTLLPLMARAQGSRFLITDEERQAFSKAERERSKGGVAQLESSGTDPNIQVLKPAANGELVAPIDFVVRFSTTPPHKIDVSSIAVKYGWFDITKRLRDFGARIDEQGIFLERAPLKPDVYKITVEVANTGKQASKKTFRFQVT